MPRRIYIPTTDENIIALVKTGACSGGFSLYKDLEPAFDSVKEYAPNQSVIEICIADDTCPSGIEEIILSKIDSPYFGKGTFFDISSILNVYMLNEKKAGFLRKALNDEEVHFSIKTYQDKKETKKKKAPYKEKVTSKSKLALTMVPAPAPIPVSMLSNVTFKQGDILGSKCQVLVNTVNCVGVMGKGVALQFKNRYPAMFRSYKAICDRKELKVGEPLPYKISETKWVINFPTKNHWRNKSKLEWITSGLNYMLLHMTAWGFTSIAFPPLGCGNGGLKWDVVRPLILNFALKSGIPVEIHEPFSSKVPKKSQKKEGGKRQTKLALVLEPVLKSDEKKLKRRKPCSPGD